MWRDDYFLVYANPLPHIVTDKKATVEGKAVAIYQSAYS